MLGYYVTAWHEKSKGSKIVDDIGNLSISKSQKNKTFVPAWWCNG
jgi:hypothetical protein